MRSGRGRATRDWAALCAFSAVLFLLVPVARPFQEYLKARGLDWLLTRGPGAIVLAVLLAAIWRLWVNGAGRRPMSYFHLANLAIAYLLLFQSLAAVPVERVHMLEYGVASVLALRVARHYREGWSAWFLALLISADIGFLDEAIQYFTPRRVYDPRDVATNVISGILGLLFWMRVFGFSYADRRASAGEAE